MKIMLKNQSIERKNSDLCIVTEYPMENKGIDFAVVRINGQYPAEKCAVNQKCTEIVYVQSGSGEVIVNGEKNFLNEGDLILIEAGEKFVWKGNMTLCISCRPAFCVEQHQIID